jgi:hypothetical protein
VVPADLAAADDSLSFNVYNRLSRESGLTVGCQAAFLIFLQIHLPRRCIVPRLDACQPSADVADLFMLSAALRGENDPLFGEKYHPLGEKATLMRQNVNTFIYYIIVNFLGHF